jgi:hypothetical protein
VSTRSLLIAARERKTPILLRRGPLSGDVMALHRYTHKTLPSGRKGVIAGFDGKQDVSHDFDALMLEELLDNGAEGIVGILDGVADGESLTDEERAQVRCLRERLKTAIERHNARQEDAEDVASVQAARA